MLNCPFSKFELLFCKLNVISQLGDDSATWRWFGTSFAAWRWFNNVVRSCEDGAWAVKWHSCAKGGFRNSFRSCEMGFGLWNFRSTLCSCLQMAITSSFQLQFVHHLKRLTPDFLSFEMTYNIHNLSSSNCSKSGWQWLSSWMLHVRFLSLLSLLAFMICFWQRITKL